jgi:undecaprenyl-diphosphatase
VTDEKPAAAGTGHRAFVRRRADVWAIVAGAAVLVPCMIVVRDGTVGAWEASVFHALNGLPEYLYWPLWITQTFGLLLVPLIVAGVAFLMRYPRLALALAALPPVKLLFEWQVVKALVERQRPGTTVVDAILRDAPVAGLSFPSGHAVIAFAMAGVLAPYGGRRWKMALYTLAALNGLARIYLGAHNPLDIVAGAALGVAIAGMLNLVVGVPAGEVDPGR